MKIPPKYEKVAAVLILIASLALSFAVFLIPLDDERLRLFGYGGLFIVTLLGAMTLFVPGPTLIAAFAVGAALNPLLVALVAGFGSALGESTGYLAAFASKALINPNLETTRWYGRILKWMRTHTFLTVFLLAAIPNLLTDLSGLVAGRMSYSYPKFLLATFLGKTIRFGLSAFLGSAFGADLLP